MFVMQRKKGCGCLGPGGEMADELIERSKVERSLMLRKPQTPFGVVWSLLELKSALQGTREKRFMFLYVCHLCVFLFTETFHCVLEVELFVWLFIYVCVRPVQCGSAINTSEYIRQSWARDKCYN